MNAKLTLSLNSGIIEYAKYYAKEKEISLSKLIENYLHALSKSHSSGKKITPLVESLTGIIPDTIVDERKEYRDYVTHKYA